MKDHSTLAIETAAQAIEKAVNRTCAPSAKTTTLNIGSIIARMGRLVSLTPDYKLAYLSGVVDGLSMGEIEAEHDDSTDKTAS